MEEVQGRPAQHFTLWGRLARANWFFENHILPKVLWVQISLLLLVALYAFYRAAVDGPGHH